MINLPRFKLVAVLLFTGMCLPAVAEEGNTWRAGVAKESITPKEPVWLAGYAARNSPSDGVLTELYARALVLTDSRQQRLVMLTLELIEVPDALRKRIVDRVQQQHGIASDELLINVSHTHGGPMISAKTIEDWGIERAWGVRAEKYVDELLNSIDKAIESALGSLAEVTVSYSHSRCGFAMNRRLPSSDGIRLAPNPNGIVDHEVPVLRIDSKSGQLVALVFGYACHNTALGPTRELHGDYAGFAQEKLEQDHPETVALFLLGCGGDQDPSPRRSLEDAKQNGLSLALAVEGALAAEMVALPAKLSMDTANVPIAFAPLPSRAELESRAQSPDGFVSRHARMILEKWPKPGDQPDDYQYPIQVVSLGGKLNLIALGGEPMAEYAVRLRSELAKPDRHIWVAGYSNLVNAYIPNRRVLREGGYEGTQAIIYQSLPAPFAEDIEERIVASVRRQLAVVNGEAEVAK